MEGSLRAWGLEGGFFQKYKYKVRPIRLRALKPTISRQTRVFYKQPKNFATNSVINLTFPTFPLKTQRTPKRLTWPIYEAHSSPFLAPQNKTKNKGTAG